MTPKGYIILGAICGIVFSIAEVANVPGISISVVCFASGALEAKAMEYGKSGNQRASSYALTPCIPKQNPKHTNIRNR